MRLNSAKFVLRIFTHDQKENSLQVMYDCGILEYTNANAEFMNVIITVDETLVYS